MKLSVGDHVVYASHGVGTVTARRGTGQEQVVVLEFPEGLSVTLPIESALELFRPVSSELDVDRVRETLGDEAFADEAWRKRLKDTKEKVRDGGAVGLAEVVRDGAHREHLTAGRGATARLSLSERQLYLKARRLLANELCASLGVDSDAADDWISDQLNIPAAALAPAAVARTA